MEHEITFNEDVFQAKASGSASPRGFINLFDALINEDNWSPGGSLLVDYRDLSDFNPESMNFSGISAVASFIKKNKKSFGNMKAASLLRDTMNSRVMAGLLHSLNEFYGSEIKHDIFTDNESAVKWLKSG